MNGRRIGRLLWALAAQVLALVIVAGASAQQPATQPAEVKTAGVALDPALKAYEAASGVAGSFKSVGSDTMVNMVTLWYDGYRKFYPNVRGEIEGKGSGTAPVGLREGTATFGAMSREMRPTEIDSFEAVHGYKPTAVPVAIDMLAIYVHKDNPLAGLTLPQADAIFSKDRRLGHTTDIKTWGDLGLTGEWADKPISHYGRNAASGTYGFFKEVTLGGGDYKDSVKEQPGSSAVVQGVANDLYGIGYSGIGYKTADVRVVPLAIRPGQKFVPAEAQFAYTGDYPLARRLLVYINYKPGTQLDPLRREFIRYVLSRHGQEDVIKDGYYPITGRMAERALQSVGIKE